MNYNCRKSTINFRVAVVINLPQIISNLLLRTEHKPSCSSEADLGGKSVSKFQITRDIKKGLQFILSLIFSLHLHTHKLYTYYACIPCRLDMEMPGQAGWLSELLDNRQDMLLCFLHPFNICDVLDFPNTLLHILYETNKLMNRQDTRGLSANAISPI